MTTMKHARQRPRRTYESMLYPPRYHKGRAQHHIDSFLFWGLPMLSLLFVLGSTQAQSLVLPDGVGEVLPWLIDIVKQVVVG